MDYDEDELHYDSQEELEQFDEDKLTNEEYDLLHDLLPQLKTKLKSYNDEIPDLALKEALYFNYFELEPSIEELKSNFKTQKREQELSESSGDVQVPTEAPPHTSSKLSRLAKARSGYSSSSILDQFTSNASAGKDESTSSPPPTLLRKKLERTQTPPRENVATLKLPAQYNDSKEPPISFDIALDDSVILNTPRDDISIFWFQDQPTSYENSLKRRRLNDAIFHSITNIDVPIEKINKAQNNFNKPSPDDEILNAQKQAFEGVGNLKIDEAPKEKSAPTKVKETKPFKKLDIDNELTSNPQFSKPHKSFVVIGHVDAGKSTLMGRLLFDYGIVDAKTVNKLVKESEKIGKGSFALAWIMDQTEEERSHGVTVDICATDFEVESNKFTAIDAPGHRDFVPQLIGGVSNADFALLVVDSITGEFEAGFALDGQTKEHTILAKNLGIENICVVVNKMDKEDWSENRFETIKTQLLEFLTSSDVDFKPKQIDFVPISGLTGNNVVKRDPSIESFKWYNGPTLAQYIENVPLSKDGRNTVSREPFYLSVHDVYKDKGDLKVIGKINSGFIQSGETVVFHPSDESLQVSSLQVSQKTVDFAIGGQLATLLFKSSQVSNESADVVRIGDVVTKVLSSIRTVKKFTASVHLFNMDKPLLVGMPFVLFRNSSQVPARITNILEITNSNKKKKKKILHLTSKQDALIEIEVDGGASLPLTTYEGNSKLGRIVLRREGQTIGAGKVTEI
ncbi:hypothetical protein CANMA_000745 [Candida margitis]|uniref:uncharacterized protein n=1 Tax=Candida margitis TaxID=1775924 RepID=UPI0022266B1D|nr:uncharacterized protein CANMA_000745 [Candida margitis]KAI5970134.1 hypothetical protein CANMA_000745 [Candida margitis]